MNILIIGNGFDLANQLPTKYIDFLRICELVRHPYSVYSELPGHYSGFTEVENKRFAAFCKNIGIDRYIEFSRIAVQNLFITHFIKRKNYIGDKWLNFEEEIERLIGILVQEMKNASDERIIKSQVETINDFCSDIPSIKTYKELFLCIRNEHKDISRLLEIYMDGYINNITPERIMGFKKGFYSHILSFNYTDTYGEKYEPEIGCCYIHGKANVNNSSLSKIVLGFDDRYINYQTTELEKLPYEKFFQRLDLGTSNEYMKWLEFMKNSEHNLVDIYGHSLAQADADILREFILSPRTITRIYYYDDLDRYEKLRNLTMILEPKTTIELVGGTKPRIVFDQLNNYSASVPIGHFTN